VNITYLLTDRAHRESATIVFSQLIRLHERGHNVSLFLVRGKPVPGMGFRFPVYEFGYTEQARLVGMLQQRDGIRVATDWITANMVAELKDNRCMYLATDFETKLARGYPEARGVIAAHQLGLPMVTTSSWAQDQFKRVYDMDIPYAAPGIDYEVYAPGTAERNPHLVAYVSIDEPMAGDEVFRRAIRLAHRDMPSLQLLTLGVPGTKYGHMKQRYSPAADERGFAEILASVACFVSSSHHETFGLMQLNAMACGCPVVATRAGGNEAFCDDDVNCLLVDRNDPEALGAAIARLVGDCDLQRALSEGALKTAARFSWENGLVELERVFREQLAMSRTSHEPTVVPADMVRQRVGKVSVVIPTKNGEADLESLLQRVETARRCGEIEVIIVDSGSTDSTVQVARDSGATILEIPPEEFNHGDTRNRGAELATGEYLVFLTQDVIPIGDDWLDRLVAPLEDKTRVVASTVREVPRTDADLFGCWGIWAHHNGLEWHGDRVAAGNPSQLSQRELRASAQLTTNCLCIRRDGFGEFGFKPLDLGEDLDLGVRLLAAGHRLAYLYSSGVVHSHNRSPYYALKRHHVDSKLVPRIMGTPITAPCIEGSLLTQAIRDAYGRVCRAASSVSDVSDADGIVQLLHHCLTSDDAEEERSGDAELGRFVSQLPPILRPSESPENTLAPSILGMASSFAGYISTSGIVLADRREELPDALFKLFAAATGSLTGALAASELNADVDVVQAIDVLLSRGV
jgi:glycosyltransferase involved in cell wall biosynthesis/GT2 family glycosyltransferase